MDTIDERIAALAQECAAELGLQICSLKWRQDGSEKVLECTLDRPGGIDLEEISRFTDLFSPKLDLIGGLDFSYTLDCSSPGAERIVDPAELWSAPDRFIDAYMELIATDGRKYLGTVTAIDETGLTVAYHEKGRPKKALLKSEDVLKAQLRVKI